jgi:xanthine dehydrogenase accessory factor
MDNLILTLARSIQDKQPAVLATVVEAKGASPARPGAQLVLLADATTIGTAGGGNLEAAIIADAQTALSDGQARLAHYSLSEAGEDAVGTLCGGEVRVFIQPFLPPPQLVIVGGGHIGRPLKIMGETAGFEVVVVDVEPGRADLPVLAEVTLSEDSCVVLITTDHVSDEAALRFALKSSASYIGMIGSLAKCRTIFGHLIGDGYSETDLERVYAPIGLDLGGDRPQEIAVAILAEIIAVRYGRASTNPVRFRQYRPEKSKAL